MLKQSRKRILFLILGIFAVLTAGCIVPSQQTLKTEGTAQENGPAVNTVTVQSSGLIKPVIPEQNPKEAAIESAARFVPSPQPLPPAQPGPEAQPRPEPPVHLPESDDKTQTSVAIAEPQVQHEPPEPVPAAGSRPSIEKQSERAARPARKREWEDQKVKQAAHELAKNFQHVSKIKVCYAVKDDEWWVVLYDDAGAFTELKQYTWNRDQEKLEAFLVVKRIPSGRVQEQSAEEEPGKACEVLEPAPADAGR